VLYQIIIYLQMEENNQAKKARDGEKSPKKGKAEG